MKAGWSARRVARQLDRSDCVVGGVGTSGSERYHLHEDQAQDARNKPVIEKTATSDPCDFSNHTKAPGRRTFGIVAPIACAALEAHPSTPPFAVVPHKRKLDSSGMEPGRPESISAVITIVFVCGDPVENASILSLLYSYTPLPQLV
ncbi:hypothetical protein TNCV_4018011 [Trichonephila clavipes]|nr:hypothetical protein TNCV_4018011 [Trichonephila clavipes]